MLRVAGKPQAISRRSTARPNMAGHRVAIEPIR
jgi:hypothetical protein